MTPLVTVITPCYNSAAFIKDAMESVIAQTYTYWEMLIVDDCSTDDSARIIKEYSIKDGRIKYYKTDKNSGAPSTPRNIALDNAKGEYVAFLDSDDIWLPEKLEKQVAFMNTNNCKFGYSYSEKVTEFLERNGRIMKTKRSADYNDLLKSCEIICHTAIIDRDIIGDTRFECCPQEDYIFWLDIMKKSSERAYNLCEVTAFYRERKSSRSSDKLNMLKEHWTILRRKQGLGLIRASYCMVFYTCKGLKKWLL